MPGSDLSSAHGLAENLRFWVTGATLRTRRRPRLRRETVNRPLVRGHGQPRPSASVDQRARVSGRRHARRRQHRVPSGAGASIPRLPVGSERAPTRAALLDGGVGLLVTSHSARICDSIGGEARVRSSGG